MKTDISLVARVRILFTFRNFSSFYLLKMNIVNERVGNVELCNSRSPHPFAIYLHRRKERHTQKLKGMRWWRPIDQWVSYLLHSVYHLPLDLDYLAFMCLSCKIFLILHSVKFFFTNISFQKMWKNLGLPFSIFITLH